MATFSNIPMGIEIGSICLNTEMMRRQDGKNGILAPQTEVIEAHGAPPQFLVPDVINSGQMAHLQPETTTCVVVDVHDAIEHPQLLAAAAQVRYPE